MSRNQGSACTCVGGVLDSLEQVVILGVEGHRERAVDDVTIDVRAKVCATGAQRVWDSFRLNALCTVMRDTLTYAAITRFILPGGVEGPNIAALAASGAAMSQRWHIQNIT